LRRRASQYIVIAMGVSEIQAEALKLTAEERAQLVGSILDSLPGADPNDSDHDSLAEAIHRGEELKSGKVTGLSEDELMSEFRASRRK
jgi:putative addiction module component (TIGR02574 family)